LTPLGQNPERNPAMLAYYTNDIESKNSILKQHLQHKASQLQEFVESMKIFITKQRSEIEKAVAKYDEYRVGYCHSNLACEHSRCLKSRQNKIN